MITYELTPVDATYKAVTLQEAKDFLAIDYPDYDDLIQVLIDSAIIASQRFTGQVYSPSTVTITTTDYYDAYPVVPYDFTKDNIAVEFVNNKGARRYTYVAGYAQGKLPADLKQAILQRVATGFLHRENSTEFAVNETVNASVFTEFGYRVNPMI